MHALRHHSVWRWCRAARQPFLCAVAQALVLLAPGPCVLVTGAVVRAAESPSEERVTLERVALAKVRSELVERVYGLKLNDSLTIGDWAGRDLGRDRALRLWLRGMPAHGAARAYSDGSCDVTVRLEPQALIDKMQELAGGQSVAAASSPVGPDFAQAHRRWPVLWVDGSAWRGEANRAGWPEGWEDVTPEALEMTRRAAEADARDALFDALGRLPVTRARRLGAFLESSAEVRSAMEAALRERATVSVTFAPDQVAVATARISLVDLIRVLTEVYGKSYQGDLFHASDFGGMGLLATVDEVSAAGLAIPPAAEASQPPYAGSELGVPAWAAARMTATGRYVPAEDDKLSPSERAEAARRAGIDELRRGVQSLAIKDGMTVGNFLAGHGELENDLDVFLSGARACGAPSTQPGGAVEVPLELPLRRLWWIVQCGMQPVKTDLLDESTRRPAEKSVP
jgi:hypothetical protein